MKLRERFNSGKWANFIAIILAIAFTSVVFFDSTYWNHVLLNSVWMLVGVLFVLILTVVILFAGITVMKALVHAGASIALVVLLAQSYCDLEAKTQIGLNSLRFILIIGSMYIFYEFLTKFIEACKGHWKTLGDDRKTFSGVFVIILFLVNVIIFGVALYLVVDPVVRDLCINQPLELENLSK